MATELTDFYQGDTKRWKLTWPDDITGATIRFLMKYELGEDPVLDIEAVLDAPVDGVILGATFEITAAQSAALDIKRYRCWHKITKANGDVGTFMEQNISVLEDGDI